MSGNHVFAVFFKRIVRAVYTFSFVRCFCHFLIDVAFFFNLELYVICVFYFLSPCVTRTLSLTCSFARMDSGTSIVPFTSFERESFAFEQPTIAIIKTNNTMLSFSLCCSPLLCKCEVFLQFHIILIYPVKRKIAYCPHKVLISTVAFTSFHFSNRHFLHKKLKKRIAFSSFTFISAVLLAYKQTVRFRPIVQNLCLLPSQYLIPLLRFLKEYT